jgi:hypothetical protein
MHYIARTWHRRQAEVEARSIRGRTSTSEPVWWIKYLKRNTIQRSALFRGILLYPSRKLHYPSLGLLGVQLHCWSFVKKLWGFREHLVLKRSLVSAASVRLFIRLTRLAHTNIATMIKIIVLSCGLLYMRVQTGFIRHRTEIGHGILCIRQ